MKSKINPVLVVKKTYPNSEEHIIIETYKDEIGWTNICALPLSIENLELLRSEGNTKVNISLLDEYGIHRRPDYSISELLKKF